MAAFAQNTPGVWGDVPKGYLMIYPVTEDVKIYARAIRTKPGITSVLLPVGSGLEVSRYEP